MVGSVLCNVAVWRPDKFKKAPKKAALRGFFLFE